MKIIILVLMVLVGCTICYAKGNNHYHEKDQESIEHDNEGERDKRSVYVGQFTKKWTNNIIPYDFNSDTGFTTTEKTNILSGMANITYVTNNCIKFVPRKREKNYLSITGIQSGCWSSIGMVGGRQITSLNRNSCLGPRAILHELVHVIGMIHEHQRPDRDNFIQILWNNVNPVYNGDLSKYAASDVNTLNFTYDYYSVTHYRAYSHSLNISLPIILPLNSSIDPLDLGGRVGTAQLSKLDIAKIKKYYGCP